MHESLLSHQAAESTARITAIKNEGKAKLRLEETHMRELLAFKKELLQAESERARELAGEEVEGRNAERQLVSEAAVRSGELEAEERREGERALRAQVMEARREMDGLEGRYRETLHAIEVVKMMKEEGMDDEEEGLRREIMKLELRARREIARRNLADAETRRMRVEKERDEEGEGSSGLVWW